MSEETFTIPRQMRALAKTEPRPGLTIVGRDVPTPGAGEVLIRVTLCGICGTDLANYQWLPHARHHARLPLVLGHEFVGVVVAQGPGATVPVGTRVTADSDLGCGTCWWCRRGMWNRCDNQDRVGSHRDGGLAEYVCVPERSVVEIPAGLSDTFAALLEPFGAASHAVHLFGNLVGRTAAVIGPGPIGLLAGVMLLDAGCSPVVLCGLPEDSHRLELGRKLGMEASTYDAALATVGQWRTEGADVVVDAVGSAATLTQAMGIARFGAEISLVGVGAAGDFDPATIVSKGLTVRGVWRRVPESWDRLLVVAQRHPELGAIVDAEFVLDEFEEAFASLAARQSTKLVIRFR